MGSPPPIWHAASQEWVEENFTEEAKKDGKMYAREDGDWVEIPAAVTGAFLPLAGGTLTGEVLLGANAGTNASIRHWRPGNELVLDINAHQTPRLQIGSSNMQGDTSLWGTAWIERLTTGSYASLQGSEVSVQSGGSLRLASMSDVVQVYGAGAVRIETPPAAWQSNITLDSPTVNIPKNTNIGTQGQSSVQIKGGLIDINCQGSNVEIAASAGVNINSDLRVQGATNLSGRLYRNGPDYVPIIDIPDTNNRAQYPLTHWQNGNQVPQIQIGSSNYKVDFGVNGRVWGNPLTGGLGSWNASDNNYISMGSGIHIVNSTYPMEIKSTGGNMEFYTSYHFRFYGSALTHNGDLHIQGQAYKPSGGSWQSTSDKRLKSDVEPYEDGLNKLTKLKPIKFRYNERARQAETGRQFVGLAAEEAKEVMPSIVGSTKAKLDYEDKEPTDVLTIDPSELIYTVINALKQIDERLQMLEDFYNITRKEV